MASNQVRYSLVHREIERNGILETAEELGVTIIAYSPLAQGLLTGVFHADPLLIKQRPGIRKWSPAFHSAGLQRSRPLIEVLDSIGVGHGATAAQVALNWTVTHHGDRVVAIPGATTVRQAEENAAAMDFALTSDERARIDEASRAAAR
jgi:aryl-alcohol dehydrogenase-like predicted oxidoreductase